jgi:putative ATP-binding cassette transporter
MSLKTAPLPEQKLLYSRFWRSASGFWRGPSAWPSWLLCGSLILIVLAQLMVQYRLNYWNRDFFDAIGQKNAEALKYQALLLLPLVAASITLAIASVWGRMTTQRKWRKWLTTHLINYWLANCHFHHLNQDGDGHENPEYRIAEDARIATDAPIDLALGLFSSVLTALIFIDILWRVGDNISFEAFGLTVWIPGYLVVGAIAYSTMVTAAMMVVGYPLVGVAQRQMQAEAEFRAAANLLRESGEGVVTGNEADEQRALWKALGEVLLRWRDLCWQLMRMTLVSHGNTLLAPVVALILCTPKYLAGTMSLGELTQAAAAFTAVQGAFNWLVDNYQRLADWTSSANRVATLLLAIDALERGEHTVHLASTGESSTRAVKPIQT